MLVIKMFAIKKKKDREICRNILKVFQQKSGAFFCSLVKPFLYSHPKNKKSLKLTLVCQPLQTISVDQNNYLNNQYKLI